MSFLDDYKASMEGKKVDFNGDKSYQCVDCVKDYAKKWGNPITTFWNAKDYAKVNWLGIGWVWIPYKIGMIPPRESIIVWWKPKGFLGWVYYGHIAITGWGNTKESINTLAQNAETWNGKWEGKDAISVHPENYLWLLGWHVSKIQLW